MTLVASWPSLSAMHSEGCSPEKCKAVPRNQPFYHSPPTPRNFPLIGHKNQPTTALRKGLTVCYMVSESCLWLVYVTGSRLEQKTGESVSGMYFNPVEMVKLLLKSFYKVCNLGSGGGGVKSQGIILGRPEGLEMLKVRNAYLSQWQAQPLGVALSS